MKRTEWINERIRVTEERMDTLSAPTYDENWGKIEKPHLEELEVMFQLLPSHSFILDAACGTGKYWQLLLDHGYQILGIDNSSEMLKKAELKFPNVSIEKISLPKMMYNDQFDGIICVDAMECFPPEYWPNIIQNFYQALKKGGKLYVTIELEEEMELIKNYEINKNKGFPVVLGEFYEGGGYHFYPKINQVKEWVHHAGFSIIQEREEKIYYHFILGK